MQFVLLQQINSGGYYTTQVPVIKRMKLSIEINFKKIRPYLKFQKWFLFVNL